MNVIQHIFLESNSFNLKKSLIKLLFRIEAFSEKIIMISWNEAKLMYEFKSMIQRNAHNRKIRKKVKSRLIIINNGVSWILRSLFHPKVIQFINLLIHCKFSRISIFKMGILDLSKQWRFGDHIAGEGGGGAVAILATYYGEIHWDELHREEVDIALTDVTLLKL